MKQNMWETATKPWTSRCAAVLAAGLVAACSGGDGADEAAVAQPAQFQPGERLAMKTLLLAGSSQTRCCVVHGVTLMA